MPADFPYRRLPGSLRGFVRKASLWEGSDHLLSVTGTRFSEKYRRFYYRDIQAIIIEKSARMGSLGLWCLIVLAFFVCLLLAVRRSHTLLSAAAVALCVFLIARLVITLRFSCRCYIQTAVSRELLPSILRAWKIQPMLSRLRPRITDVQGTLAEDLGELLSQAPETPSEIPMDAPSRPVATASENPEPYRIPINLAIAGFVFCLIDAASCFYSVSGSPAVLKSTWMQISYGLLMLCQGGAISFALMGIYRSRPLRSLRNFLIASLCFTGLEVYLSTSLTQLFAMQRQLTTANINLTAAMQLIQKIDGGLGILLGFGGLILILLNWQSFRRGTLSSA